MRRDYSAVEHDLYRAVCDYWRKLVDYRLDEVMSWIYSFQEECRIDRSMFENRYDHFSRVGMFLKDGLKQDLENTDVRHLVLSLFEETVIKYGINDSILIFKWLMQELNLRKDLLHQDVVERYIKTEDEYWAWEKNYSSTSLIYRWIRDIKGYAEYAEHCRKRLYIITSDFLYDCYDSVARTIANEMNDFGFLSGISTKRSCEYPNVCAYAPAQVKRNDCFLVQVFIYHDEESGEVKAKAVMTDKNAELRQYKPLELPIKKGDEIKIQLSMDGTELSENTKSFIWQGKFNSREFSVFVPENYSCSEIHGNVFVFINNVPAGEMMFTTEITSSPQSCLAEISNRIFSNVFISYSHRDKDKVAFIHHAYQAIGVNHFFDKETLKTGGEFPKEIEEWIKRADLFILCWSKNSAASEWVNREKDMALHQYDHAIPQIKLFPMDIEPHTDLPDDMKNRFTFGVIG